MKYFVVLNDGETFTSADGCRIVALTGKRFLELEESNPNYGGADLVELASSVLHFEEQTNG